ncbi:MAG: hypothetical protein GTO02_22255 [Candidatus Dadabacteria bacterium]|nr:hypothetical protein [Candidatus Dadabacteria bacterium]NIQ17003.1 hypothetical protein [Candidatus Dadabacteria bacterium]
MNTTRRNFIKTVTAGVIGSTLISFNPEELFAKPKVDIYNGIKIQEGFYVINKETQKSVAALADTFLPGSNDLKLINAFMNYFSQKKNHGLASFFDAAFWNLDTISHSKFKVPYYKLTETNQKDEVINHVRARNRIFISRFERLTKQFYYTHPKVLKKLKYSGPPQPKGFMDYGSAPA